MVRGIKKFKCDNCGHTFKDFDIEWCCSVFSAPCKCPKCGSFHTAPQGLFGVINPIYRTVWESMDKN